MIEEINIPKIIYLYKERVENLNSKQLEKFIKNNFGNIKIEWITLKKETMKTNGLLFDFLGTQRNFQQFGYTKSENPCHIVLTNRLFATLDEYNKPHIRAAIFSFPSVISTAGIVEGPAKPKEFYFYKQKYSQLGVWDIEEAKVKKKFRSRFIDYQDKRMSEVLKGYIAQAIFFYMTGEPFCKNKSCRLFNAHWQEDLIYAQIKSGEFCLHHKKILEKSGFFS